MRIEAESVDELVRFARESSELTKVAFAQAAGTTRAAIDEYEKGRRVPRVDSLVRVLDSAGLVLEVHPRPPQAASADQRTTSLAAFVEQLDIDDPDWVWRSLISDFVANEFAPALQNQRPALVAQAPALTGSREWDAFVAALAEHLCFHADIATPAWIAEPSRGPLSHFWWPVHGVLPTMKAAAMAHSPAAFRWRCINVDGRELPLIMP